LTVILNSHKNKIAHEFSISRFPKVFKKTMKLLAVLLIAFFAIAVESHDETVMKVVGGCKESVGASDEDLQKFMVHTPAENKVQKCLASCVMGGLGIVS
jgi:hypothetical protein